MTSPVFESHFSPDAKVVGQTIRAAILGAAAGFALLVSPAGATAPHRTQHRSPLPVRSETVEQRIATLHTALAISPAQEGGWRRVADVMRHNDQVMRAMKADPALGATVRPSAVQDLAIYEKFNQAHVEGLAELIPAFRTLYATMSPSQQTAADDMFRHFGRGGATPQG